ncbi:MAG TPA: Smr/MutS family protein [Halothiobacillus sp.]|nr:MAG: hypothetical protein B7Z82_04440 [Halothiobacillus sp. 20-54-6]HQT43715.1 Smr/MutS family protein [Halothiobacillus sp.]
MAPPNKKPMIATLNADEIALFRETIGAVDPIANAGKIEPVPPKTSPKWPSQREERLGDFIDDNLSDGFALYEPIEHGETLSYLRPDNPPSLLRKLRRGQFSVDSSLDLHGMTINEARALISAFFREQRREVRCCVRIVHGKGNRSIGQIPVLKRMVNHWLPQRDDVIAFCSTPVHDGGTGAVYVLLQKA